MGGNLLVWSARAGKTHQVFCKSSDSDLLLDNNSLVHDFAGPRCSSPRVPCGHHHHPPLSPGSLTLTEIIKLQTANWLLEEIDFFSIKETVTNGHGFLKVYLFSVSSCRIICKQISAPCVCSQAVSHRSNVLLRSRCQSFACNCNIVLI